MTSRRYVGLGLATLCLAVITTLFTGSAPASAANPARPTPVTVTPGQFPYPGGTSYVTSPRPTFQTTGGPEVEFSLAVESGTSFDEVWVTTVSTLSTGGVATFTVPDGFIEPGMDLVVSVRAVDGDLYSAWREVFARADLTGAVVTTSPCTTPCVPYATAVPLLDGTYTTSSSPAQFSTVPVGNMDDVGQLLLSVRITPQSVNPVTGLSAGNVKLYDPRYREVQAPILSGSFPAGTGAATATVTMDVGAQNAVGIAVRNISGSVRVEVTAIGWYPWESPEDAADELAEENAEPTEAEIAEFEAMEEEEVVPSPTFTPAEEADLLAANPDLANATTDAETCEEPLITDDSYRCASTEDAAAGPGGDVSQAQRLAGVTGCGGDWTAKRKSACGGKLLTLVDRNRQTKVIVGSMTVAIVTSLVTKPGQIFEVRQELTVTSGWGTAAVNTIYGSLNCTNCANDPARTDHSSSPALSVANPVGTISFFRKGLAADGTDVPVQISLGWKSRPAETWMRSNLPRMRCDKRGYIRGAGCVFPGIRPILKQYLNSASATPAIADHIRRAQQQLTHHWGRKTDGSPMTRMYAPALRKANRREARNQCAIRKVLTSCDEYPYASTKQGCALVTCHVAGVPRAQNTAQGNELSKFYRTHRLLDGDGFWVRVLP